jgi:hypothetical protein
VPDVVRAVALPPGDRRTGWALTADGQPVVATEQGLVLPGRERLAWADVEKATWQRPVLTVVESAADEPRVAGAGRTTVLRLGDEEGGLPERVHAGVTSSVAWTHHVRFPSGGGARVVGRRRPGQESFEWQVVYDPGTDTADPQVRAQAEQVVLGARRSIG